MKKILCVLVALTLLGLAAMLPTAAALPKYGSMLLLGDSITYGYGLDGNVNNCLSYGNLVRDELAIGSANFKNAAVNGDTSSDLLALLPGLKAQVQSSELIIVTIGGNDLLQLLWSAVNVVLEGNFKDYSQLPEVVSDPAKLQKLAEQLTTAKISEAIVKYTTNMAAITAFLRTNAPEAEIIFLAQYDPLEGVEGIEALSGISKLAISMLNAAMKSQVETAGCTYLDAYTHFSGHAKDWTNILAMDIHPNLEGHRQLSLLVMDYLRSKAAAETEPVTTVPDTTTEPVTEPVIEPVTEPVTEPDTTPAETTVPAASEQVTTTDAQPSGVTEPSTADESGCGSLAALGLLACLLPAAFVISRRK